MNKDIRVQINFIKNNSQKKEKGKGLSFFLPLLLGLFAFLVVPTQAQTPVSEFAYQIENEQVTITDYLGSGSQVVIPSSIEGYPVVAIGGWTFSRMNNLLSVTLPDTITALGREAFSYCRNLKGLYLGKELTQIETFAFYGCSSLTELSLPETLQTIGANAFDSCIQLTELTIPSQVTTLEKQTFYGCNRLQKVTFTGPLSTIEKEAFSRSGLTQFEITTSLNNIDLEAFKYCSALTQFTLSGSNETYSVLDGCLCNKEQTSLLICPGGKSGIFTIPSQITTLSKAAFCGCIYLTDFEVDPTHSAFSTQGGVLFDKEKTTLLAFPASRVGQYEIPDGTTSLASYSFDSSSQLLSLIAPASLASIQTNAFYFCSLLKGIGFEGNAPTLEGSIFKGVPSSLTAYYRTGATGWGEEFDTYNARGDSKDQTLTLTLNTPEVTYGEADFQIWANSSSGLATSVVSGNEQVATVDATKMVHPAGAGITTLTAIQPGGTRRNVNYFPAPTVSLQLTVNPKGASLTPDPVSVPCNYPFPSFTYSAEGLINGDLPEGTPVYFINGTPVEEMETPLAEGTYELTLKGLEHANYHFTFLPSTLTILPPGEFECTLQDGEITLTGYNGSPTELLIPDTLSGYPVRCIGDSAFASCTQLVQITLGKEIRQIAPSALYSCPLLESILVPSENENLSSLEGVLFNKDQTTLILYPCGKSGEYTLPETVTTLGTESFAHATLLTKLTLPSVYQIRTRAFAECTSLGAIYFEGDSPAVEQGDIFVNCPATIYYKDGTLGWSNPWCGIPTCAWGLAPELSIAEVEKDEQGHIIALTFSTKGTLESSSDNILWVPVTPVQDVNTHRVTLEAGQKLFFRTRSEN